MIRIFISYSSQDSKFADRLAQDLGKMGVNLFYAKWMIKVGDSIVEKINTALLSHDILLVILSNSSVNSHWVNRELNSSLMRQLNKQNIRIFPVLLKSCVIPPLLADIKYADFTIEYQSGLNELLFAFEADIDLERYLEIVEKSCPEIDAHEKQKELAMVLKRIDPITFFRNSIYSVVNDHSKISQEKLFESFHGNEAVLIELQHLSDDGLIEQKQINNEKYFNVSTLGESIYRCLSYGFNEGVLSPVCSS
ncbi:MAG: toll/interleukin-1 receptor domain-containing protein [Candidatus Delongbacteria bacterium]|nr:toll/interleukin-1 receptor domain-containing protein [Candidatus Delongbacteria bacterium]